MNKRTAKAMGRAHGKDLVAYNINYVKNEPGEQSGYYFDNELIDLDRATEICWEADDGYRSYSPFEFTCKEFNESRDPDGIWEAYENGTSLGVRIALNQIKRA